MKMKDLALAQVRRGERFTLDGVEFVKLEDDLAVVRALTIDEYRKHRSILPLTSKPYWLATGWTTNSSPRSDGDRACSINADGTVNDGNVDNAGFAPRPALYLKSSILVSVETEDDGKALADYSDTDLIDELYRRRRSTYDPD